MTLRAGDVVRIDLDDAHFYAKCVCVHPTYHEILAIDPNRYEVPVATSDALSFSEFAIASMSHALQSGSLKGQIQNHLSNQNPLTMPLFRFAVRDSAGRPIYWWLWDGQSIKIAEPGCDISCLPDRKLTSISDLTSRWVHQMDD
ncbi:hypothetical protein [Tateyamaria sp.]|uniref:hypothetical protein n=1 Tax=Tateyamaria sp. TaxID=1929288 RepID=UPI00328A151E